MFIIYGTRLLGTIDADDGTTQATRFVHVYYLPLIPMGTFELLGDDQGRPVPLSLKSVALAYGRSWGFVAVAGLIAATYLNLESSLFAGGAMAAVTLAAIAAWAVSILKLGVHRTSFGVPAYALTLGIPLIALSLSVSAGVKERFNRMKWENERGGGFAGMSRDALRELAKTAAEAEERSKLEARREKCEQGNGQACNDLGYALSKTDPAAALTAYEKGCALDFAMSCFNQGLRMKAADPIAARALYEKACGLGYGDGCNNQAAGLEKADAKQAVSLYRKGCELKSGLACRNMARMIEAGLGTKKDVKQAKVLYAQACKFGDSTACAH